MSKIPLLSRNIAASAMIPGALCAMDQQRLHQGNTNGAAQHSHHAEEASGIRSCGFGESAKGQGGDGGKSHSQTNPL